MGKAARSKTQVRAETAQPEAPEALDAWQAPRERSATNAPSDKLGVQITGQASGPKPAKAGQPAASSLKADAEPEATAQNFGLGGAALRKRIAARAAALALPPQPRPRGAGPLWGTVPFEVKRAVSPHGQVTAVSMMKDEGPFVIEWVAHHLALGFTDLVVFTNDCSDGTDDMLIRLEELGLLHHRRNVIPEGLRPQPSALNHAEAEPVVQLSDWVMVFDADEFLSIRHGDGTLDGLISAAKEKGANGIVVTWRIFGSGGVVGWSRAPVTEQYLQAAPQDWNKGWGVKTLFQYDPEVWKLGIHRPKLKTKVLKTEIPDQIRWLNGSGAEMEDYFKFRGWRSITRTVGYDWVQLNHYAVKSVESYALRKLRGNVNNKADKYNSDYWALQDRNETRDETMLRYSARRDGMIAALLKDPELKRLHEAALARVEARLAEIRPTPAYAELVEGLAAASALPIGAIVAKPPQARDPAKIAALMSDVERLRGEAARALRKEQGRAAKAAAKSAPREVSPSATEGDFGWELAEASDVASASAGGLSPAGVGKASDAATRLAAPRLYTPDGGAEAAFSGDWVANQGVELPLDGAVFSPAALALVARGKFERALARHLPGVLPPGRVLNFGAGVGFLAIHLARQRRDLQLILAEPVPHLARALQTVLARNPIDRGQAFVLEEPGLGLAEALHHHRPQSLLLGVGSSADSLYSALSSLSQTDWPEVVLLHDRALMEESALHSTASRLAAMGFKPAHSLSQALTLRRV